MMSAVALYPVLQGKHELCIALSSVVSEPHAPTVKCNLKTSRCVRYVVCCDV